jgi:hypothetical protein
MKPPGYVSIVLPPSIVERIERRKLAVDKILPLHGRVVPVSEPYATARMRPKQ